MTMLTNGKSTNQNLSKKILWVSEIKTDPTPNPAIRLNLELFNKKEMILSFQEDFRMKIGESERIDKRLDLSEKTDSIVEHESDGDTNYNWSTGCC